MADIATPARDRAAFLAELARVQALLAELHDDAARLAQPQAVTMGLMWLRDDAAATLADAQAAAARA